VTTIAHALEAACHVITCARQISEATPPNRQVERCRLQDCGRLEQLERDVIVAKLDALVVEASRR
jgi:hypothetical protein